MLILTSGRCVRLAFHWRGFGPHGRVEEWCAVSAHHSLTQPCGPKPRQWKAGLNVRLSRWFGGTCPGLVMFGVEVDVQFIVTQPRSLVFASRVFRSQNQRFSPIVYFSRKLRTYTNKFVPFRLDRRLLTNSLSLNRVNLVTIYLHHAGPLYYRFCEHVRIGFCRRYPSLFWVCSPWIDVQCSLCLQTSRHLVQVIP